MTNESELKALKIEVSNLVQGVENRAFLYLEENNSMISVKGSFSDDDALNFISALVHERPEIKEHVKRWINE